MNENGGRSGKSVEWLELEIIGDEVQTKRLRVWITNISS
jgi:hypothetical protein